MLTQKDEIICVKLTPHEIILPFLPNSWSVHPMAIKGNSIIYKPDIIKEIKNHLQIKNNMTKPNFNEIAYETNRLFSEKTRKSNGNSTDEQNGSFLQLGRRAYWTPDALQQMKGLYEKTSCPSKSDMETLSEKLNCDVTKIHTWFKNRRQQQRRKNNVPESKFQMDSAQSGGRVWFSRQVKDKLLEYFNEKPYLSKGDAEKFAEKLNIPEQKIENWFKNQRQKSRKEGAFLKIFPKKLDTNPQSVSKLTTPITTIEGAPTLDSETADGPVQSRCRVFLSKQVKDDMLEYFNSNPYTCITKGEVKKFAEKWSLPEKTIQNWFKNQKYKLKKTSQPVSKPAAPTTTKIELNPAPILASESAAGTLSEPITSKIDDGNDEHPDEEINVEDLEDEDLDEDVPLDDLIIKHQLRNCQDLENIRVNSLENSSPLQPHQPIKFQPVPKDVKVATYQTEQPMIFEHFQNDSNHLMTPLSPQFHPNFMQFCSLYQKYCNFLALQSAALYN